MPRQGRCRLKRSNEVKLDEELLRHDLLLYTETALSIGLPCPAASAGEVEEASDAELVDMAATIGWDLGKYVEE